MTASAVMGEHTDMGLMGTLAIVDERGSCQVFLAPDAGVAYAIMSVYGSVRRLRKHTDSSHLFSITCGARKVASAYLEITVTA